MVYGKKAFSIFKVKIFLMSFILKEIWLWITIFVCIAVAVGSFLLIWAILQLPGMYRAVAVIILFLGWGVAGGYKDYLKGRKKS